ncbi:MAG: acyltransferase domain-containing protein [Pseudoclavibacter sp.]
MKHVILLFPGQGAYTPGLPGRLAATTDEAVSSILNVAKSEFGVELAQLASDRRPIKEVLQTHPDEAQFAIFAESVRQGLTALAAGVVPLALLGHSFGEIAALTVAGCFSPADGARVVGHRLETLRAAASPPGAMLALATGVDRVDALLRLAELEGVAIAGINGSEQTVVSGPRDAMAAIASISTVAGVQSAAIPSPHAFHNALLTSVSREFSAAIRPIPTATAKYAVYSPILHRQYGPEDDLATALGTHLTEPFDLAAAVQFLTAERGEGILVECGAGRVLTGVLRRACLPEEWTVSHGDPDVRGAVDWAALARSTQPDKQLHTRLQVVDDDADAAEFQGKFGRFWQEAGSEFEGVLQARFAAWQAPVSAEPLPSIDEPSEVEASRDTRPSAQALAQSLAELYAEALEYPVEVFLDDTSMHLEADLGVDSVKQTDLLGRAAARFGLEVPETGFAVADYPTFESICELVRERSGIAA